MKLINIQTYEIIETTTPENYSAKSWMPYTQTLPDCATKYMKWNTAKDKVLKMTTSQIAAVDAEELATIKAGAIASLYDSILYKIVTTDTTYISKKAQIEAATTNEEINNLIDL
ncbi:MAG: hypothetical protein GY853_14330 [PVC group bacterium]|nr:hypothetical protein [PVC group bacterium]